MQPYYDSNGITIYHGDCREILPNIERADLLLTDPPYNRKKNYGVWSDDLPETEYVDLLHWLIGQAQRISKRAAFVVPRERLPLFLNEPASHLIIVRRGAVGLANKGWKDQFQPVVAFGTPRKPTPDIWDGIRLKGEGYFFKEEDYGHPGYTPYDVLQRSVDMMIDSGTVVDPFMGTGTTLLAARDCGCKAIGIELNEKYCEIAVNRLGQLTFNQEPE